MILLVDFHAFFCMHGEAQNVVLFAFRMAVGYLILLHYIIPNIMESKIFAFIFFFGEAVIFICYIYMFSLVGP